VTQARPASQELAAAGNLPGDGEGAGRALDVIAILALVAFVAVPALFARDLWNPDEPRYMEVAREMVVLGDYLVPHLNGEVYSQKPPLFFWLVGALWRMGAGYNAARLVSLLAVAGTLLLTYALVRALQGRRTALLAAFASASTVLVLSFTKAGVLDPLLTLLVTGAMVTGFRAFHKEATRRTTLWLICYGCMGLATLTKGPVGFILPGLSLLAYGVVMRKEVRGGGLAHLAGVGLFAAIVLAWLVPAIIAGGADYARAILLKQNIGRAVGSWSHRNPFYYYLWKWPIHFFPWSFALPLALVAVLRQRRAAGPLPLLAALWLLVPFAFLSLVSGKRINYLLPVMPAVGMLCAWYVTLDPRDKGGLLRAERWLYGAACALVAVAALLMMIVAVVAPAMVQREYPAAEFGKQIAEFLTPGRKAGVTALLAVPLAGAVWGLARPSAPSVRKWCVLGLAFLSFSLPVDLFFTPAANLVKSGKHFGQTVSDYAGPGKPVYLYADDYSGVYNLWTSRARMPMLLTLQELTDELAEPDSLVIGDLKRFRKVLGNDEIESRLINREYVGHRIILLLRGGPLPFAGPLGQTDSQ